MADSETTPLIQNSDEADQSTGGPSWQAWAGAKLQSPNFHALILILILLDFVIVVVEICWVLLNECTPGGDHNPTWLEVCVHMSTKAKATKVL